jgi:hypothetical protein
MAWWNKKEAESLVGAFVALGAELHPDEPLASAQRPALDSLADLKLLSRHREDLVGNLETLNHARERVHDQVLAGTEALRQIDVAIASTKLALDNLEANAAPPASTQAALASRTMQRRPKAAELRAQPAQAAPADAPPEETVRRELAGAASADDRAG